MSNLINRQEQFTKTSPCERGCQPIIHLQLQPFENKSPSEIIELSLWAELGDWLSEEELSALTIGKTLNINLDEKNLRIRHLPCPNAMLKLLGKEIPINQNLPNFQVTINAKVQIQGVTHSKLVARIVSGYVEFVNPIEGLSNELTRGLWSSTRGNLDKLIFGRSKLQIRVSEVIQTYSGTETLYYLYEFAGKTRKKEDIAHQGILWKFTRCEDDSQLSTSNTALTRIRQEIDQITASIYAHDAKALFSITGEQSASDIYIEVVEKNKQTTIQEFFQANLMVNFRQEKNPSLSTSWLISTIKKTNNGYKLYNYDEIAYLLVHGEPAEVDPQFDFVINWEVPDASSSKAATRIFDSVPLLFLTGINASESGVELVQDRYIWQPLQPIFSGLGSLPPCWMRLQLAEELPEPIGLSSRFQPLKDVTPMIFNGKGVFSHANFNSSEDWQLQLSMPENFPEKNLNDPSRIELQLTNHGLNHYSAHLSLRGVELSLSSPPMDFLETPQQTPHTLPGQKSFNAGWKRGVFRFQNSLSKDFVKANRQKNIIATIGDSDVKISSTANLIITYLPNHLALIDTVSASGDNLPPKKFLSPQLLGEVINLQTIQYDGENTTILFPDIHNLFQKNNYTNYLCQIVVNGSPLTLPKLVLDNSTSSEMVSVILEGEIDHIPDSKNTYTIIIGTEKRGYERDTNMGLIPLACNQVVLSPPTPTSLAIAHLHTIAPQQPQITAIQALLPWVEGRYQANPSGFTQEQLELFHRSLVQERAERILSEEYGGREYLASTRNPVRDRFCKAASNLDLRQSSPLQNWLPYASVQTSSGDKLDSNCRYETLPGGFPKVIVDWKQGSTLAFQSVIGVENQENDWLRFTIFGIDLSGASPTIKIDAYDSNSNLTTINSFTPLLFDQRKICDATGTVKSLENYSTTARFENWTIEHLFSEGKEFVSLSVVQDLIATGENTQFLFSCKQLIIPVTQGETQSVEDSGWFRFDSKLLHANSLIKSFPRYKGVIVYPTKITSLLFSANLPDTLEFEAVIINPETLSHIDQEDSIADAVQYALNHGRVLTFSCSIPNRLISLKSGFTQGFAFQFFQKDVLSNANLLQGRFVSIEGNVQEQTANLQLTNLTGTALALGNNWPIDIPSNTLLASTSTTTSTEIYSGDCTHITGLQFLIDQPIGTSLSMEKGEYVGYFAILTPKDSIQPSFQRYITDYTGTTPEKEYTLSLENKASDTYPPSNTKYTITILQQSTSNHRFSSSELTITEQDPALTYELPLAINLTPIPIAGTSNQAILSGKIHTGGVVSLSLQEPSGEKPLIFKRVQGTYYCFQIQGSAFYSMILWPETSYLSGALFEKISTPRYQTTINSVYVCEGPVFGIRSYILADQSNWRVLEYLSAILNGIHPTSGRTLQIVLSDQWIFDSFHPSQNKSVSAYIKTFLNSVEAQFPIKLDFSYDAHNNSHLTLLEENYYYATPIEPQNTQTSSLPDLMLPEHNKSIYLKAAIPKPVRANTNRFVKITAAEGLSFKRANASKIPINLCLEKDVAAPVNKLPSSSLTISHAKLDGYRMRIDLNHFSQLDIDKGELASEFDFPQEQKWIISPIMKRQVGGNLSQLTILQDNLWILNIQSEPSGKFSTEILLILNRMRNQSTNQPVEVPFYALLATTTTPKTNSSSEQALSPARMQKRIIEAGAYGVAIHQTVSLTGELNADYIESPFFSFSDQSSSLSLYKEKPPIKEIDSRLVLSKEGSSWSALDVNLYYEPQPNAKQPRPDNLSRFFSYQSQRPATLALPFPLNWQPALTLNDIPAYEDPQKVAPTQSISQNVTTAALKRAIEAQELYSYFLPKTIQFQYGSDKPGAVFHHDFSPNIFQLGGGLIFGRSIGFHLREPQQIAILGESQPEIRDVKVDIASTNKAGISELHFSWTDVLGKIDLTKLDLSSEPSGQNPLELALENIASLRFRFKVPHRDPFQVIFEINSQLAILKNTDPLLPFYQLKDEKKHWPKLFFVSKQSPNVFFSKTTTVELKEGSPKTITFNPYLALQQGKIINADRSGQITTEPQELEEGQHIFIQGAISGSTNPYFVVKSPTTTGFKLNESPLKISSNSSYYVITPLDVLSTELTPEAAPYHVYQVALSNRLFTKSKIVLQVLWLASIEVEETEPGLTHGTAFIPSYEDPKILKGIGPSLLTSKVAGVIRLQATTHDQVLFFGDAGASGRAIPALEKAESKTYFTYSTIEREDITSPILLPEAVPREAFYVFKYLPHGQIIYNGKQAERNAHLTDTKEAPGTQGLFIKKI